MSRVPRIRFKGFEEDWEQRKLGVVVEIYDGVHQTPKYQDNGIMFLSVENIVTLQSTKYISEDDFKRDYKVYPQENDILMTRIGDVGTTNVIADKGLKAYYVSLALLKYKSTNPYFLSNAIQSEYVKKELANRTLKTAIPMKINKDEIGKVDVMLPILVREQTKIGEYFRNLDHLITLHQSKSFWYILKSIVSCTLYWEQRKLGEIAEYKKGPFGSALRKDIFVQKGKDTVKIYEQQNAICKDCKLERYFVTKEYANKLTGFEVYGGDIIVSCAGTIGEIYEIPYDAEMGIINQALMRIKVYQNVVDKGIFIILFSNLIDKFSIVHSNGSAIKNIPAFSDLKPTIVFVPSIAEQKKISKCFESLNNLITLHQRKLEKLKIIKKSMLENLFPQNGEKTPKIRFSGFTKDWEQRKFGELYELVNEKNDGSYGKDSNITVATMQFKSNIQISKNEYLNTYNIFKKGYIAFEGHKSKEFRFGRFVENDIGDGIVSHIFIVFRPITEFDINFWKYAINNEWIMQSILSRATKASTMMNDLVVKDFLKEIFFVPSVVEQACIGKTLKSLDHLITLHQSKLEKLQKIKKSMLESMFV